MLICPSRHCGTQGGHTDLPLILRKTSLEDCQLGHWPLQGGPPALLRVLRCGGGRGGEQRPQRGPREPRCWIGGLKHACRGDLAPWAEDPGRGQHVCGTGIWCDWSRRRGWAVMRSPDTAVETGGGPGFHHLLGAFGPVTESLLTLALELTRLRGTGPQSWSHASSVDAVVERAD